MSKAIAWIIEPAKGGDPWMTLKGEVAEKRAAKGDIVTPYESKIPTTQNEEDEEL